jgi:hypothetical protein
VNDDGSGDDSAGNVVDLLTSQHHEINQLFTDLANASRDRGQSLFDELVRLLVAHESAEEQLVHPIARHTISDGTEIVDARLDEEANIKQLLADLVGLGVDHPEFDDRLHTLGGYVARHAAAEETLEFSRLRSAASPAELVRLAGAVRAAQAIAPHRPHPVLGESATANVLLGVPVAWFDRVRDAIRHWRA